MIIQWGLSPAIVGENSVSLNVAFSGTGYIVNMTATGTSVDGNSNSISIGDKGTTSFVFREHGSIGAQNGHFWLAIGY